MVIMPTHNSAAEPQKGNYLPKVLSTELPSKEITPTAL